MITNSAITPLPRCRTAGLKTGIVLTLLAAAFTTGCLRVKVEPIHITVDVNIKVDKELDSFFGDLDAKAAGRPAATPKLEEKK